MDITISKNFKKMTSRAILAVIIFILVYLLLVVSAIALTALCIFAGFALIVAAPRFITIALGVGLASLGVFVLIFLFKFLFKKHKVDRSHLTEIRKEDYPQLFKMIEDIVKEVKTDFPKKVYLSKDVNAGVFYDSSFWSLFFSIRKNLQIGIGLVNTITEQELKAILAHEFGHFSQRTMSVGSYGYYVNEVIYNMLNDNDSFNGMIQAWANIAGYFAIFVIVSVKIINGIQWILQKMYSFVNIRYMALSREMEFHADEVAAHVAGSSPLIESLKRMSLSQHTFDEVLNFYSNKVDDSIKSKNIYKEQFLLLQFIAKEAKLPIENDLPLIPETEMKKQRMSKLNFEDQWASHPSVKERITALEKLNIEKGNRKDNLAINLFPNAENIEKEFTQDLFSNINYQGIVRSLESDEFLDQYIEIYNKFRLPEEYNGYYDNKSPMNFDLENLPDIEEEETMDTLFAKDKIDLINEIITLENDKDTLSQIENKQIIVVTFDYAEKRYSNRDAKKLIAILDRELDSIESGIKENDIKIYNYFRKLAVRKGEEDKLKEMYINQFKLAEETLKRHELYLNFLNATSFIGAEVPQEQVGKLFSDLYQVELRLRPEMKNLMEKKILENEITTSVKNNLAKYLAQDWSYSANLESDQEYIETLYAAVHSFNYLSSMNSFMVKKELLYYQVSLLK